MTPRPGLPASRAIRVLEAATDPPGLQEPETFHALWGGQPLIVRGWLTDSDPLWHLRVEELEQLLGESSMRAYPDGSGQAVSVPAREVLDDFRVGCGRFNVGDHGLAATPLGVWVKPPLFPLNDHHSEARMRGWLWERSVGTAPDLDPAAALRRCAAAGDPGPPESEGPSP